VAQRASPDTAGLLRTHTAMQQSTIAAVTGTAQEMCSPRNSAAQATESSGWARLSCPMRAVPPVANRARAGGWSPGSPTGVSSPSGLAGSSSGCSGTMSAYVLAVAAPVHGAPPAGPGSRRVDEQERAVGSRTLPDSTRSRPGDQLDRVSGDGRQRGRQRLGRGPLQLSGRSQPRNAARPACRVVHHRDVAWRQRPAGPAGAVGDLRLPEGEHVRLDAGLEERDLQGPLADRVVLAHELVEATVAE
jgi:hypothetical protein